MSLATKASRTLSARWVDRLFVVALPITLGVIFIAILVAQQPSSRHDLQLILPPEVAPGTRAALRAFLFASVDDLQGGESRHAPVRVQLRTRTKRRKAEAWLRPGAAAGMEGNLAIPSDLRPGGYELHASSRIDKALLEVTAHVRVQRNPKPTPPRPRLLATVHQLTLLPTKVKVSQAVIPDVSAQVQGGVCVPAAPCTVMLHLTGPPISVRLHGAALDPGASVRLARGVVPLRVVPHGPFAEVDLSLGEGDREVATKKIRLPLLLGGVGMEVPERALVAGDTLEVRLFPKRDPGVVVLDGYHNGVWSFSRSLEASVGQTLPLQTRGWPPGLWRLQARPDPYDTQSVTVALVHVSAEPMSVADRYDTIEYLARGQGLKGFSDPPWHDAPTTLTEDHLRHRMAQWEQTVLPSPHAVSGRVQAEAGLDDRRVRLRWVGALAFVLGGLASLGFVIRRAASAGREADQIMEMASQYPETAGEPAKAHRRARRWAVVQVSALLLLVLLAFATSALVVAIKNL